MNHSGGGLAVSVSEPSGYGDMNLWLQGGMVLLLLTFLYYSIVARLAVNWWTDPNFSHGIFVPAFSAFVIWVDRKRLAAIAIRPSWSGAIIILWALALLIVGVLGAEIFLSRTSLIFLMAGLVIFFLGWGVFRAILFPWACLFLMVPIPAIIFNQITFPLQILASKFASNVLDLLGVPVLREGNVLQLPAMSLEVAQACSGIRSLMSLGTLAVIYGYFLEPRTSRRVILALAAIPIAILANGLRIVGTGLLVHYWDPAKAEGFFHEFTGWVIFVLSLFLLFAFHSLVNFIGRLRGSKKT